MPSAQNAQNIPDDILSKRRRFQPPITSFFSSTASEETQADTGDEHSTRVSHYHYSTATNSATPVVPETVQSSLLSVGMRVRKSVAEGYKTLAVKPVDKPLSYASQSRQIPAHYPLDELAPFCGVSKSGDFVTQPSLHRQQLPRSSSDLITTDDGDTFSLPASSQESASSFSFSQKRGLDSDLDELDDPAYNQLPAAFSRNAGMDLGRTILTPRRPQNMSQQAHMDVDDFEDPVFLRCREEVDADYMG